MRGRGEGRSGSEGCDRRDSFSNVVELLDDLFERAATADEPTDMNFIRKHALELQAAGETVEASTARIFSNPPGEFGSLVNERVTDGSWEDERDLGETWAKRNAFSFGRSGRGVERRSTLNKLMATTGQVRHSAIFLLLLLLLHLLLLLLLLLLYMRDVGL
eukprot:745925-Hanusia_phi.AAC.6